MEEQILEAEEIRERLFAIRDEAYAPFMAKLIPTVPRESVIGVRTPALRGLGTLFGF